MNLNKKIMLVILLLLCPVMTYASSESDGLLVMLPGFIFMEAFVSIHMSIFVLSPISKMIAPEDSKKKFWQLFWIRVGILLFFDFFITPFIAIIDFFMVFIGAAIIVPVMAKKKGNNPAELYVGPNSSTPAINNPSNVVLNCVKCGAQLNVTDSFCPYCGTKIEGNNVKVSEAKPKERVLPSKFDAIYSLSEDKLLEEFINRELTKAGIDKGMKLIPTDILKRKKILNIIFSILVFVYISLIFFHFPIYTYVLGFIILLIYFIVTRKYDLMKYLKKQVQSRPQEKISNIVMNVKNSFAEDNSRKVFMVSLLVALVLPLLLFNKPRILYEKVDGGYAVRYYIFGLSNFTSATIPPSYKGEKVVSLRGNTFSNMFFLEKVELPDSIKEIRGQAFMNCLSLVDVNIPSELEYLGGGAFSGATSIRHVELPDTLTYLGGEAFYGAKSLTTIRLSNNLEEIRGDTFEYCTSLESITIPDSVVRIGGHAFYGDSSLSEVYIGPNSKLIEIGSSAFRQCSKLYEITIPKETYVNERAFKESPTTVNRYGEY